VRRLAPDRLTSGARASLRVAPTSVRSVVISFLERAPVTWFCDGCVALEIKASLEDARAVMAELEADHRIERGHGRCSRCTRSLYATRMAAGRSAA
jgi:hypothetical protein